MSELDEIRNMCSSIMQKLDAIELAREEPASEQKLSEERENIEIKDEEEGLQEEYQEPDFVPTLQQEAELICVTGIKPGIGVTHHCVLFASFLQNAGVSVAIADFTEQEWYDECDIPVYKADEQFLDQIAYQYQVIICDLGCFEKCDRSMFRRSKNRIVLAGFKTWEKSAINRIFDTIPEDEFKRYTYVFNFTRQAEQEAVLAGMQGIEKVYFASITEDPLHDYGESVAEKIFPEYVTANKKRKGFLGRK